MKRDDSGSEVKALQRALNAVGLTVAATGWYGEDTVAAVTAFQQRVGLVADGVAGPKTLAALSRRETDPRHLKQADLERAADRLGVPLASVMAVNAVESCGNGFLDDGRVKILYERHVAYRRLDAAGADAAALAARYPALINPERGGYAGGAAEWARLASVRQITPDYPGIAEEACSWGAFQIMGYHWQTLGYDSIAAFVAAMQASEGAQLDAFIRFIEADPPLLKALKAKKWAEFARLYNGPAYKDNLYDVKLARAFERFSAATESSEEAPA